MGKTEKIGGLAEDAVEAITDRRRGGVGRRLRRWAWQNAFPAICGLIVMGAATFVTDLWDDYAETKAEFVDYQMQTDYKFRRTEDALRSLAAENVALRTLLEEQQVEVGVVSYKLDWHHPPRSAGEGPPMAAGAEPPDFEALIRALESRLGRQPKVGLQDIQRILDQGKPLYEQRQMPAPAGGR